VDAARNGGSQQRRLVMRCPLTMHVASTDCAKPFGSRFDLAFDCITGYIPKHEVNLPNAPSTSKGMGRFLDFSGPTFHFLIVKYCLRGATRRVYIFPPAVVNTTDVSRL
jgi:hypothetical protein